MLKGEVMAKKSMIAKQKRNQNLKLGDIPDVVYVEDHTPYIEILVFCRIWSKEKWQTRG